MKILFIKLLALLCFLPGISLGGNTYYVTQNGSGSMNGTYGKSWSVLQFNSGGGNGNSYGAGDTVYFSGTLTSEISPSTGGSSPEAPLILDGYKAGNYNAISDTPSNSTAIIDRNRALKPPKSPESGFM